MDATDPPRAAPGETSPVPAARRARGKRSVTMGDVARHAGVSSAVVSYVVNSGPRPVAEATRERVSESIRRLGYRPNAAARALKSGSTNTIGLAVPNNTNPYFAELSQLIEMAAEAHGYETIFVNASDSEERERRHLQKLLARRIDGLLLASAVSEPDLSEIVESGTPVVLLDRGGPFARGEAQADSVGVDYRAASRTLVRHLLEHGHDEVALVVGDERLSTSRAREQGWRDALEEAGRRPGAIVRAPYSREGGYVAGRRLLEGPLPPAVVGSSDMQSIGVLRALREAGIDVPGDIALVSFDGTIESEYTWPPLTVMRQPVDRMAEAAVALLLGAGPTTGEFHSFDAELVVRSSCGCGAT